MFIFALCIGIIIGLMIGTYLGAQIIDEKNRELKYLRTELAKAVYDIKEEGLLSPSFLYIHTACQCIINHLFFCCCCL